MIISELMLWFSSYSDYPDDLDDVEVPPFLYLTYRKKCENNKVEVPDYYTFLEWYSIWFMNQADELQ